MALHKYSLKPSKYTFEDLASSLGLVPDLIDKIGGKTKQVIRCQKIVRLLLQPASALIVSMQSRPSAVGIPVGASCEELQATFLSPSMGFLNGSGSDEAFADLCAFSDELSTLFPGGF